MTMLKLDNMISGGWNKPISMEVPEDHVLTILGRNGTGKTTLLNTIAGLIPVRSGKLSVNNCDATRDREIDRIRRGVQIAP